MSTNGFRHHVVVCWPSDPNDIARLNRMADNAEKFVPSVEHSLSSCDGCRRGVWIAPAQQQMVESPFTGAKKLCMFCVAQVNNALKLNVQTVDLDPAIVDVRPRIA